MIHTFGKRPAKPAGMFAPVTFPVLAMMDQTTGDGRRLASGGGGARPTPTNTWSFSGQFEKSYGHDGAVLTGAIYEISLDDDTGIVSGLGYMADTDEGRKHAFAIKSKMMAGISVGLAEVSARLVEDLDTGEYWIEFTKWNVADASGVMAPAFYEAYATIDEEITAALDVWDLDEELVASCEVLDFRVPEPTDEVAELIASASAPVQAYRDFFRPEASEPTKIVVTADGKVYGHACLWDTFHASMAGSIRPPRPTDGYKSFNKPGVLTERGIVPTGPIFAYGGHKRGEDLNVAYGGIENAWCDVRAVEGVHGMWVSGVVRPGVSEETVYAARASRISGHWLKGDLKAIVSVNAEGYEVPGSDADVIDIAAGYAYSLDAEGHVLELVASFDGPAPATSAAPATYGTGGTTNIIVNMPGDVGNPVLDAIVRSLQCAGAGGVGTGSASLAVATERTVDASLIDDDLLLALLIDD